MLIGSLTAVLVGALLWMFVGPAIARAGIVSPSSDHAWSFFQAYSWLSGSELPPSEVTAIYWAGIVISGIGLSLVIAGVIGALLALARARSQTQIEK